MTADLLPNFVYLGPDKAGSTWLHKALAWHPEVFAPTVKDLFYFDRYLHRGEGWYASHFAGCQPDHKVAVDVSHDYLFDPTAVAPMRSLLGPELKLMVTLREPIDRAYSAYLFMIRQGRVRSSFAEAVDAVPELLDHGRYAMHLLPYFEVFERPQVFTPVFDDLQADPEEFAGALFRFLGVGDHTLPDELTSKRLSASRPRLFHLARIARSAGVIIRDRGGERLVSSLKRSSIIERALYAEYGETGPPAPDPELVAQLRDRIRPDVEALDGLLGTTCAKRWGYTT